MTGPTPSASGPAPHASGSPAYLAGLLLRGRRVVVVGGGRVAARRVPKLIEAEAVVELISPVAAPALVALADAGRLQWSAREFQAGDLDGAWYVIAATDAAEVNAMVVAEAESRHTFCVRADRAEQGSAWTPATGEAAGITVALITNHDPIRARRARDRLLEVVADESL